MTDTVRHRPRPETSAQDEALRVEWLPSEGTKKYELLRRLLNGERVDPFIALMEMNLPTLQARCSELRAKGWPVRSVELKHPKLEGEVVVAYFFDKHFRQWMMENIAADPRSYPYDEGRGKFAATN